VAPYCLLLLPSPSVSLRSGILSRSDTLSPVTKDQIRGAVISSGRPLVYPLWLASPLLSGSPRWVTPFVLLSLPRFTLRSQPVMVTLFHGIVLLHWMFLNPVTRRILGTVRPSPARPCSPYGFEVQYDFPLEQPATGVLSFPLGRPWAVRFFSFV